MTALGAEADIEFGRDFGVRLLCRVQSDTKANNSMSHWSNLYSCFGNSISSPSSEDMKIVLTELFSLRDDEHPDAWLETGLDGGPMESLSIFSSGYAIHIKYSDADMTEELFSRRIENVTERSGLELWRKLLSTKRNS